MNNAYFEGGLRQEPTEKELVDRIKECEAIADRLENDEVWKIIIRDAKRHRDTIDAIWQDVDDEKQLSRMKILKLAYNYLINLPDKYKVDLRNAKNLLDAKRNKDSVISKDYDLEGIEDAEETGRSIKESRQKNGA